MLKDWTVDCGGEKITFEFCCELLAGRESGLCEKYFFFQAMVYVRISLVSVEFGNCRIT